MVSEELKAARDALPEYILCAAYWVNDGIEHVQQPVPTGYVIGGWRHHSILEVMAILGIDRKHRRGICSGFITSRNRYVEREEAMKIAKAVGQFLGHSGSQKDAELYSEDIY